MLYAIAVGIFSEGFHCFHYMCYANIATAATSVVCVISFWESAELNCE